MKSTLSICIILFAFLTGCKKKDDVISVVANGAVYIGTSAFDSSTGATKNLGLPPFGLHSACVVVKASTMVAVSVV